MLTLMDMSNSIYFLKLTKYNKWASRRALAVAGRTAWNSLSDDLRDPTLSTDSFRRLLTTRLFSEYQYTECIRGRPIALYALCKFTTYLVLVIQVSHQNECDHKLNHKS